MPMEKRKRLLAAFMVVLLLVLSSCGSESGQNTFYSVDVVNSTDATITVRYDWDYIWWNSEWFGKVTIPQGSSEIIEWSSDNTFGERIEVEYMGIKKLYTVSQMGTVIVVVQDFQN